MRKSYLSSENGEPAIYGEETIPTSEQMQSMVDGISGKEPGISSGDSSQYYRGDKTWQTLDKAAVGLSDVDNVSDASKPVSTATQTALDAKASACIVTPSSPTTGQTVSASTGKLDETLYITPSGALLALTVSLPASANSRTGQIIRGFISQIITGLTVNVSGSGTVNGSTPVTSAVNSTFAYQCSSVAGNGTWIRIQ